MNLKKFISILLLIVFISCCTNLNLYSLLAEEEKLPVDKTTIKGEDKTKLEVGEKEEAELKEKDQQKETLTPQLEETKKEPEAKEEQTKKQEKIKRGKGERFLFSKAFFGLLLLVGIIVAASND
ncbi:MAG: hypothetical protein AB1765_02375 [Candidatus Hydrogenedentota bacterium]